MVQLMPSKHLTRLYWLRMVGLASVFLLAGSGVGFLFKRFLVRRIRVWVWNLHIEEDKEDAQRHDERMAMAAVAAARGASCAAAEVSSLSQVLLKMHSEGRYHAKDAVRGLQTHVQTLIGTMIMVRGILEETGRLKRSTLGKGMWLGRSSEEGYNFQDSSHHHYQSMQKASAPNGHVALAASARDKQIEAQPNKKPASFAEVVAMLERGETPPGIKEINDKPPIPNQLPSASHLQPKPKPWERNRAKSDIKVTGFGTYPGTVPAKSFESRSTNWLSSSNMVPGAVSE